MLETSGRATKEGNPLLRWRDTLRASSTERTDSTVVELQCGEIDFLHGPNAG